MGPVSAQLVFLDLGWWGRKSRLRKGSRAVLYRRRFICEFVICSRNAQWLGLMIFLDRTVGPGVGMLDGRSRFIWYK
jgi:hypothetical protein